MDELLQRVAELKGMPASLVERSAQARADKTGTTIEAVLQEWAGEDPTSSTQITGDTAPAAATEEAMGDSQPVTEKAPSVVAITTDHLVQLAAEAKRMPPKLILSSATARAEHSNASLEEVLANWAGTDLETLRSQAPADTPQPPSEPEVPAAIDQRTVDGQQETAAPKAAVAAVATTALSMDELLEKVVEVKGMPAALAKRSAEARSKKTGEPIEAVLAEWAGVELPKADSQQPSPAQTADEGTPKPADEASTPPSEPQRDSGPEVIEAAAVEVEEPPKDEDGPVARSGYPKWLAAAFVLIPLFAVVYILVAPNGPDCGTAGQLLVDPATGESVACDGTEYGSSSVDYFAEGAGVYARCAACHGADGSGGAGPAFAGGAVLATFPSGSCSDHQEWVRLGTSGWPDATYGANSKPVGGFGVMPSYLSMSDEDIAAVVLYERVQFGRQLLEEALTDCGLDEGTGDTAEAAGS
jgi:mono/diheme cytochrome c family protein